VLPSPRHPRRDRPSGLDVALEIDGGVKVDNAQRAVDAGATVLIAASGIFAQPDPAAAAAALAEIVGVA
jgi:ribulose-phosphate 3-epimerase